MTPLESLVATGTKLWLDGVDPDLVREARGYGATGATSNPAIVSDLVRSNRFDRDIVAALEEGLDNEAIAWRMTDHFVRLAQQEFIDVHARTRGDDGYVSFELDPLIDDFDSPLSESERTERYIELGKKWSAGHSNRMIKVPATRAGLNALEELAAAGVTINVTLLFTQRQYRIARDAIWRGTQRRKSLEGFKSVYSIFISRIDVYTREYVPELSPEAQGQVGIVNAKRLWRENCEFWRDKRLPLAQEIVFASTGVKTKSDPPDKYVTALAGSDIMTNPPETNAAIQQMSGKTFARTVDQMPPQEVLDEIDAKVDFAKLEELLMREGIKKFADPQKSLLDAIDVKRASLQATG